MVSPSSQQRKMLTMAQLESGRLGLHPRLTNSTGSYLAAPPHTQAAKGAAEYLSKSLNLKHLLTDP